MLTRRILPVVLMLLLVTSVTSAQPAPELLVVVGWNVEGFERSDPATIAERIAAFEDVDLWGLSEVTDADDAEAYEIAAEIGENADYESIVGTTGNNILLVILYDAERFTLIDRLELREIQIGGRAPLVAHFLDAETGGEFLFMVNHLLRGNDTGRRQQAQRLNDWAEAQTLPVIAVGDYNFDWEVINGDADHDPGYDNMVADGVWEWVRPNVLVRTQCSALPAATTEDDCGFNSVLDFVFVSGVAQRWRAASEIIVFEGDFPDTDATSDHRPVLARFGLGVLVEEAPVVTRAMLLERIERLEAELAALRDLVEQLPEE